MYGAPVDECVVCRCRRRDAVRWHGSKGHVAATRQLLAERERLSATLLFRRDVAALNAYVDYEDTTFTIDEITLKTFLFS